MATAAHELVLLQHTRLLNLLPLEVVVVADVQRPHHPSGVGVVEELDPVRPSYDIHGVSHDTARMEVALGREQGDPALAQVTGDHALGPRHGERGRRARATGWTGLDVKDAGGRRT